MKRMKKSISCTLSSWIVSRSILYRCGDFWSAGGRRKKDGYNSTNYYKYEIEI